MFGLFWLQVISFVFAHDLSPYVTYNRLLASAASWMPLVEQDLIYHLEPLCLTPVLMALLLLKLLFLMWTIACLLLFSLSLSLWYLSFGMLVLITQMFVFRFSLCLLGLKLPLSLVRILYFAVICILIRLHQSKKAHSATWQALLICKYQIISNFPCCSLQNMNIFSQWSFFVFCNYMWDVNMKRKSLSHDGQQFHQYQQTHLLPENHWL
jgi:hypothetical protein